MKDKFNVELSLDEVLFLNNLFIDQAHETFVVLNFKDSDGVEKYFIHCKSCFRTSIVEKYSFQHDSCCGYHEFTQTLHKIRAEIKEGEKKDQKKETFIESLNSNPDLQKALEEMSAEALKMQGYKANEEQVDVVMSAMIEFNETSPFFIAMTEDVSKELKILEELT